jgi:hypothetical protein
MVSGKYVIKNKGCLRAVCGVEDLKGTPQRDNYRGANL